MDRSVQAHSYTTIPKSARRRLARPPSRLPTGNPAHPFQDSSLTHPVDIVLDAISLRAVHLCSYLFPVARERLRVPTLALVATDTLFPVVRWVSSYIEEYMCAHSRAKAKQFLRDGVRECALSAILLLELAVLCVNLLWVTLHALLSRHLLRVWRDNLKCWASFVIATPLSIGAWTTPCGFPRGMQGSLAGLLVVIYALLPRRRTTTKVMALISLFSAVALLRKPHIVTSPFNLALSSFTFATNSKMALDPWSATWTLSSYSPPVPPLSRMGPPEFPTPSSSPAAQPALQGFKSRLLHAQSSSLPSQDTGYDSLR